MAIGMSPNGPQMPGMPGLPGGGMPPGPPGGGPSPLGAGSPVQPSGQIPEIAKTALGALDGLTHSQPSGTVKLNQVKEALKLCGQLIAAVLPDVQQMEPKVAKDLHVIGRQIADAQINLTKDIEPGPPPELLMAGLNSMGMPGAMPPPPSGM